MTAIILAGGKSSRMGFDKAFIEIEGVPLIKRQLRLLGRVFKRVIIVTNSPRKYRLRTVKVIQDIIPGQGPLGGIYAGLIASSSFYNFVAACDMPFLNEALIRHMIKERDSFDVVVPRLKKGYESLFAIYSKNCIMPIHKTIASKNLRIRDFFKKVKVKEIKEAEVRRFGKPDILFMNINTPLENGDASIFSVINLEKKIEASPFSWKRPHFITDD